jgi:hypothetical protein
MSVLDWDRLPPLLRLLLCQRLLSQAAASCAALQTDFASLLHAKRAGRVKVAAAHACQQLQRRAMAALPLFPCQLSVPPSMIASLKAMVCLQLAGLLGVVLLRELQTLLRGGHVCSDHCEWGLQRGPGSLSPSCSKNLHRGACHQVPIGLSAPSIPQKLAPLAYDPTLLSAQASQKAGVAG